MWYEIIDVHLDYLEPESDEAPELKQVSAWVTIEKDGATQEISVPFNEADTRQLNNLLRQKIDKLLNGS